MFKFKSTKSIIIEMLLEKINKLDMEYERANQKLINYIDLTRAEALESYRKGLQDGLNIQIQKDAPPAEYKPVRTIQEHETEIKQAKETKTETDKLMKELNNFFSYDGSPQKEEEE